MKRKKSFLVVFNFLLLILIIPSSAFIEFDLLDASVNKPKDVPSRTLMNMMMMKSRKSTTLTEDENEPTTASSSTTRVTRASPTRGNPDRSGDLWYLDNEGRSPYSFGYEVRDGYGNSQYRRESSDSIGQVTGSYGYWGPDGLYRHVEYVADSGGYRASLTTSEPGVDGSKDPASVRVTAFPSLPGSSSSGFRSPPSFIPQTSSLPPPSSFGSSYSYPGMYSYSTTEGYPSGVTTSKTSNRVSPSVSYEDDANRMFLRRRQQQSSGQTSKTSIGRKSSRGPGRRIQQQQESPLFSSQDIQYKESGDVSPELPNQKRITRNDEVVLEPSSTLNHQSNNSINTRRKTSLTQGNNNRVKVFLSDEPLVDPKTTTSTTSTTTTTVQPLNDEDINEWRTVRSGIRVSLTPSSVVLPVLPSGLINEFRNHGITHRESMAEKQKVRQDFGLQRNYYDLRSSLPFVYDASTTSTTTSRPTTTAATTSSPLPLIGGGIGRYNVDRDSFSHGLLEVPAPVSDEEYPTNPINDQERGSLRKLSLPSSPSSLSSDSSNEEHFNNVKDNANNKISTLFFDENTIKPTTVSASLSTPNPAAVVDYSTRVSHPHYSSKHTTANPWFYFEPKRLVTRPISYQFSRSLVSLLPRKMPLSPISSEVTVVHPSVTTDRLGSSTTPSQPPGNQDSLFFREEDIPNKVTSDEEESSTEYGTAVETATPTPLAVEGESSAERRRIKEHELALTSEEEEDDYQEDKELPSFWKKKK